MGHTVVDLLRRERVLNLGHNEVSCVATLALLHVHYASECFPHAILPFEVILLHALVIVAFTALTDPGSTHLCKVFVDLLRDNIVMLVRLVAEAEDDVFETVEFVFTLAKHEGLIGEILHKLHSIIGRFAFTVSCHNENRSAVLENLIQILEFIFFRVTNEGSETKLGFGFLSNTDSVFLSGPRL